VRDEASGRGVDRGTLANVEEGSFFGSVLQSYPRVLGMAAAKASWISPFSLGSIFHFQYLLCI
jgi:hypothetical protein